MSTILTENMALLHKLRPLDPKAAKAIEDAYLDGRVGPNVTNLRLVQAINKASAKVKP